MSMSHVRTFMILPCADISDASCLVQAISPSGLKPDRLLLKLFANLPSTTAPLISLKMPLAALLLALLTIALSAYFLPKNFLSKRNTKEGADAQILEPKEGCNGGVAKAKIPISVNYHLTRQCNYSCGSSRVRQFSIPIKS